MKIMSGRDADICSGEVYLRVNEMRQRGLSRIGMFGISPGDSCFYYFAHLRKGNV